MPLPPLLSRIYLLVLLSPYTPHLRLLCPLGSVGAGWVSMQVAVEDCEQGCVASDVIIPPRDQAGSCFHQGGSAFGQEW